MPTLPVRYRGIGLNIIQTDGKPNHQGSVYVRGNATGYQSRKSGTSGEGTKHSIGQGGSALVLIDGVEGDLTTVNPEDVETISGAEECRFGCRIRCSWRISAIFPEPPKQLKRDRVTGNYNGSFSINRRNGVFGHQLKIRRFAVGGSFRRVFPG